MDKLKLPHSTLHQMRTLYDTYVTRDLIKRGRYSPKIVQALLGHSHPSVTLEFYTQGDRGGLSHRDFRPNAGNIGYFVG